MSPEMKPALCICRVGFRSQQPGGIQGLGTCSGGGPSRGIHDQTTARLELFQAVICLCLGFLQQSQQQREHQQYVPQVPAQHTMHSRHLLSYV